MESSGSEHEKYSIEEMSSGANDEVNKHIELTIPENGEEVDAPVVGMSFSTMNEMHEHMWKYSYSKGFGVVKYHNTKNDVGNVKCQTYTCNRAGTR